MPGCGEHDSCDDGAGWRGRSDVRRKDLIGNGAMTEPNPYKSPETETPIKPTRTPTKRRKANGGTLVAPSLGLILVLVVVVAALATGIIWIGLLVIGILLMMGGPIHAAFFGLSERQVRRKIEQRLAAERRMRAKGRQPSGGAADGAEPEVPPEDFLRQLEEQ